ncbi:MAG: rhodanese-like domain-containing protein [Sporichthyaceae bacterium]
MATSASDIVKAAKERIENLDADAVERELADGAVLVDLREPSELAENGRIPGAVHVPRGVLEWKADPAGPAPEMPKALDARVILHCAGGGRSALAAVTLQEMGYSNVAHLESGFAGWKDAGKPVER